ncbi:MAG: hypothetical protein FJ091_10880 [Deltaproteobacteria bacterium]|nr:hypothetical protein [Deltaproteobacteria bacterium]
MWIAPLVFALLAAPAFRVWRASAGRRDAPERSVAAFFALSGLGFALRFQALNDGRLDTTLEIALNSAGHVALSLASIALLSFTQRIFRPTARAAMWGGSALSLAALALLPLDGGATREDADSLLALNALRALVFSWSFLEAFLYWRQMRRRAALGLGDHVVANRFLLWSIWSAGLALCFVFVLGMRIAGRAIGADSALLPTYMPMIRVVLGAVVLASFVAICLCFFPPARYRAWIARPA